MIILFFKTWWKEIAVALAVLGSIWYVTNLQDTVKSQAATIAVQKAENRILVANDVKMTAALQATTTAFNKIDDIDKTNKTQFAKLESIVATSNGAISQRLSAILKEKKPVTCEETIQYLITGAKGYSK